MPDTFRSVSSSRACNSAYWFQRSLFVLVAFGQNTEAFVRYPAGNIILIEPLEQCVELRDSFLRGSEGAVRVPALFSQLRADWSLTA